MKEQDKDQNKESSTQSNAKFNARPNPKAQFKSTEASNGNNPAQLQEIADNYVEDKFPVQRKEKANNTGLPDNLKSGIENLSGHSMDDVKVHYNSDKPAQLQAHAYAQGNQIHIAPGQEKHLPHEAWHVVQQKQGRVKPTKQLKSKVNINDDHKLEKEADVMGQKALQLKSNNESDAIDKIQSSSPNNAIQRAVVITPPDYTFNRNAAIAWKGGGAYADTPSIINGHVLPPLTNKEGMILEPRLAEVGGVWRTMPETQNVGSRIEAPTAGPWVYPHQVGLDELDAFARAGGYNTPARTATEEAQTYTLIVHGAPSDAVLHQAIIVHELHHVAEQDEIIDDILIPWDDDVTAQNASADDPLNAGVAYDALGIPKAQTIADEIASELRRKGIEFHGTEEGKEPDTTNVILNEALAEYHVYLTPHA